MPVSLCTTFVELSVTTLIPDSWEMPSYLAGDLIPMNRYRDRERETVPDEEWTPGQNARVFDMDYTRDQKKQRSLPSEPEQPSASWEIEPYDPEKHGGEPAEMYSQDSLDALHAAGFEPHESGVWHRPMVIGDGENLGAGHILTYEPGHRRPTDNSRAPWHLMTDPETAGLAFRRLRGPGGAISAADADVAQIRKTPKHARLYLVAAQSPGRANADDWLAQHPEESFEHDPRAEAHSWMDQNADQYEHWEPSVDDYTYNDVGDAAGQRFDEHGEARPTAMPGHFRDENAALAEPEDAPLPDFHHEQDEDGEEEEVNPEDLDFADHNFTWRHRGDVNTTPVGEYQNGEYVHQQHDPEGNHIATHTIHRASNGGWHLESGPSDMQDFLTSITHHRTASDALDDYRQNATEALLPDRGYEPHRGRTGWITHWSKTTPAPEGSGMEDYNHEIITPENGGFLGQTFNDDMRHGQFALNGSQPHFSHNLADVVREQDRLGRGIHPGGPQDFRLSREQLEADPTVSRLGRPMAAHDPWRDNRINRMRWSFPSGDSDNPTMAVGDYNWGTGNYDFRYEDVHGRSFDPSHPHVPEGAPVTVPGRAPQLPLEGVR